MITINFIEITEKYVKIREATKQGYAIATDGDSINLEQPNSKTRRGRVGHQIAQTLTCSCNQGVIINKNNINNKGENNMKEFKNETLTKLKFDMPEDMKEIRLFDSFAGIGALHNSLQFLGIPTKIIGLSETDVDATISYACVHIDNFLNLDFNYPSEQEMREWLINRNIGWDFQKQKSCVPRLKKDKLYKVYKASVLLDNYGDISQIEYNKLPDFDLFNFSFPCTDISNSGKQKGFKNEDGTPTRSGLVKYGIDLIKSKKPKYIMIENVKALIQKKFIDDFYDIINEIELIGYKCYYPTKEDKKGNKVPCCLNAKNYAIPQNRERIFIICVRNDCNDSIKEFWEGKDFGYRLKDFLENTFDEKYYLSQQIQDRFKRNEVEDTGHNDLNVVGTSDPNKKIGQRDITYGINGIMSTLTATDYKQPKQILGNDTVKAGQISSKGSQSGTVYNERGISQTLCACTHGYAMGNIESNFRIRKLTPKECWRLMGFTDKQFNRAKESGISDSQLYKQAGNSIVVNCLYYIFKELFKNYIVKY